jgi:glycosyltransferase involved in cell wall biosynthesis
MPTDPIRLALVITELAPGGAERCLAEIATRLDRKLLSPVVYSLAPPPDGAKALLVNKLQSAEIPVQFLGLTRAWQFLQGVGRLRDLLRDQRAEVVQTFLFHANVVGARAARQLAIPHATGFRVADPRRWRLAIERSQTAAAAKHVCVSQSVADFYRQRGFDADKLVVIPNGIDARIWRDAQPLDLTTLGVPPARRAIVYVGRLDKQKGLPPFFQVLPAVFDEFESYDLLIVGDGQQRAALFRLARELGIANRVHFAGWRGDVPNLLAAADLLVLPSRWEGMPNAILEAMAAGKPVVAARAQGVVELLGPSADEQSAPVGSLAEFRDKLSSLLRSREAQQVLGARNQERAFQQFSVDFCVTRYSQLFSDLARGEA